MRIAPTVVVLVASLACADDAFQPADANPRVGFIGATLNDESFSTFGTVATLGDGFVVIKGVSSITPERQVEIRLRLRPTPGTTQIIGAGYDATAIVIVRSEAVESWTADGTRGTGTITLTSLTPESVAGTFEFTANAIRSSQVPTAYRAVRGTFTVPYSSTAEP